MYKEKKSICSLVIEITLKFWQIFKKQKIENMHASVRVSQVVVPVMVKFTT